MKPLNSAFLDGVYRLQIKSSNEMLDQLGERFGEANVPVECDVVVEKTKQDVCEVVCRKAEELNAATLVLSTKKKNEVRCVFDRGELGWGCDSRTCLGAADGGYLLRQCGGVLCSSLHRPCGGAARLKLPSRSELASPRSTAAAGARGWAAHNKHS
jgi:hypothetical protein